MFRAVLSTLQAPSPMEDMAKLRKRHDHTVAKRPKITGIALGANSRSFLMRDGQVDVLMNVPGTLKAWSDL